MGIKQDDNVIIDDSEDIEAHVEDDIIEEEVIVKKETIADIRREMRDARNQELKVIIKQESETFIN